MPAFSADDLHEHADAMRRLARDLLADASLAEDAVQQACVTALTRPPTARIAVAAWLRAVVRSCALDLLRSEGRRRRREQRVAKPEPIAPEDTAERLELQEAIVAAVRALGEPYTTTVWLRYFEGLSPGEIARRLGEPVKTIKTRLWRALQLLRVRLDGRRGGRSGWLAAVAPLAPVSVGVTVGNAASAAGAWLMHGKTFGVAVAAILLVLTGAVLWRSGTEEPVAGPSASAPVSVVMATGNPATAPAAEQSGQRENAAPAAPAIRPYGVLAVQVRWPDATPAPDVAVTFFAEGEPQLDRNETQAVSDASGVARSGPLRVGAVRVTTDRGGELRAEVVAGVVNEIDLVLPRGVDVTGAVGDEVGRAVAGARIVLISGRRGISGGRAITTTAVDGSFAARAVDPRWSLRAEAPGYAPSGVVDLESLEHAADATSLRVELHLLQRGGRVAGKVVDELGQGIAGALVAIGNCGGAHKEGTTTSEVFDGTVAFADASGGFTCDGLAPGLLPIAARADGYADSTSEVTCTVGTTTAVTLVMARGVTVQGCVHDESGAAVVGAVIRALADSADGASIDSLPRMRSAMLRPPETRSDATGCYRLQFLPPGTLHLQAAGPAKAGPFQGVCRETRSVRAGDEVTWDPVLVVGKTIRIAIVNEDGTPRLAVAIAIPELAIGPPEQLSAFPDRTSKICVFKDCADVPYTVATAVNLAGERRQWIYRTGVRAGDPVVRLVVPPQPPPQPPGSVSGRIVDAGHRLDRSPVQLSLCSRLTRQDLELRQDRFHADEVEPGRYFVWATTKDGSVAIGPWFDLHSGQNLDVGDLVTEPAGTVHITVRGPAGADLGALQASLGESWNYRAMRFDGQQLVAENVTAGRYRMSVRARGWYARPHDVEVQAGRDTRLTLEVVPAIVRKIMFVLPLPELWKRCEFALRDAGGTMVAEIPGYTSEGNGPFPYFWEGELPLGQFSLEATLDGEVTRWPVDLSDSTTSGQVLRFSLRER